jgi:hypothetical protein
MNIAGKKLSNGDVAVAGGLLVGLITVFLPWYGVSYSYSGVGLGAAGNFSSSVGALSSWSGWLFFLAVLIGIALFVLRTFLSTAALPALPLDDAMLYLIAGIVMVVTALLFLLTYGGSGASGPGYSVGVSFGLFIGIIAGAAVAAGGFLKRSDPQPATKPLSAYQTPTTPPSSAPPPPPPTA